MIALYVHLSSSSNLRHVLIILFSFFLQLTKIRVVWVGAGTILLLINYVRMRSRLKNKELEDKKVEQAKKVTKRGNNIQKAGKRQADRRKKKEKVGGEALLVKVIESTVARDEEGKGDAAKAKPKVQFRKDTSKVPVREMQAIEEALRQRELEV